MKHSIRTALTALLPLLALTALASTPASAATCKKGELEAEHKTLCVEGQQVGAPGKTALTPVKFALKSGTTAVLNVPGQEWSVTCSVVRSTGEPFIESYGANSATLTGFKLLYEECKGPTIGGQKCLVTLLSTRSLKSPLLAPANYKLESGLVGEEFLEFEIKGCPLSALYVVYGSQECTLKQAEVEAVAKELVCETSGSKLELRHGQGGAVTLSLTGNLELAGASKGKKFSITP
jgi:hypothetical protein